MSNVQLLTTMTWNNHSYMFPLFQYINIYIYISIYYYRIILLYNKEIQRNHLKVRLTILRPILTSHGMILADFSSPGIGHSCDAQIDFLMQILDTDVGWCAVVGVNHCHLCCLRRSEDMRPHKTTYACRKRRTFMCSQRRISMYIYIDIHKQMTQDSTYIYIL